MTVLSTALGGIQLAETRVERAAERIARMPLSTSQEEDDTVDLSAAVVGLLEARNAYQANLRVAESAAQLTRNLLDVLG